MPFHQHLRTTLLIAATLATQSGAFAAGFSLISVPDPIDKTLTVGLWYPSDSPVPQTANTRFGQALAIDAPIAGEALPLVLISHGYGGWHGGHADTALALAEAGFVVAAPTHTGNNYEDESAPIERWAVDRPRHISATIDYLQQQWPEHKKLRPGGVGIYGFSAGGYTALSLIGALPNLDVAEQHCAAQPQEFVCREGFIGQMRASGMSALPDAAWGRDRRIHAAAIAAPGLGFAYDAQGLESIEAEVQLWSGLEDTRVPHTSNAARLAERLPVSAETHWVKDAGHFAFMLNACRPQLKKYKPELWQMLCVDRAGFDRRAFHRDMNAQLTAFFRRALD